MMGQSVIKAATPSRRSQRLSLFCKEIKKALLNMCIDNNVPTKDVDFLIESLFINLEYTEQEFRLETLLTMLVDDMFIQSIYDKYTLSLD